MPSTPILDLLATIKHLAPHCEEYGDMERIHTAAFQCFVDFEDTLSKRECLAIGEVYQSGSVETAVYAIECLSE